MRQLIADIAVIHYEHPTTMATGWVAVGIILFAIVALAVRRR